MTDEQSTKIARYREAFQTRDFTEHGDSSVSLMFLASNNAGFSNWLRLVVQPDGQSRHHI